MTPRLRRPIVSGIVALTTALAGSLAGTDAPSGASATDRADEPTYTVLGQPDLASTSLATRCPGDLARFNRHDHGGGFVTEGPTGVAVSDGGRLFVADDGGQRVLSWPDAARLATCQAADLEIGDGDLTGPEAVALGPDGTLVVADTLSHTVRIYTPGQGDYQLSATLGEPGVLGSDATHLHYPRGVAVAANGRLFVADDYNQRVLMFDPPFTDGMGYADSISASADGGFNQPKAVALDGESLFVADYYGARVLRFDGPFTTPDQVYEAAATFAGTGYPVDLAVGPDHTLHVSFQSPTDDGQPTGIATYPAASTSAGAGAPATQGRHHTSLPLGLALDGEGRLFVADYTSYRVVVRTPATLPPPDVESTFTITGPQRVRRGTRPRVTVTQVQDGDPALPDDVRLALDGKVLATETLEESGALTYRLPRLRRVGRHRVTAVSPYGEDPPVAVLVIRVRR